MLLWQFLVQALMTTIFCPRGMAWDCSLPLPDNTPLQGAVAFKYIFVSTGQRTWQTLRVSSFPRCCDLTPDMKQLKKGGAYF